MNSDIEYKLYGKQECEKRWNIPKEQNEEFWRRFHCKPNKKVFEITPFGKKIQ